MPFSESGSHQLALVKAGMYEITPPQEPKRVSVPGHTQRLSEYRTRNLAGNTRLRAEPLLPESSQALTFLRLLSRASLLPFVVSGSLHPHRQGASLISPTTRLDLASDPQGQTLYGKHDSPWTPPLVEGSTIRLSLILQRLNIILETEVGESELDLCFKTLCAQRHGEHVYFQGRAYPVTISGETYTLLTTQGPLTLITKDPQLGWCLNSHLLQQTFLGQALPEPASTTPQAAQTPENTHNPAA